MQVVVVLFGYDIEQQVKKIYNRTSITQGTPLLGYAPVEDMRLHNILWWYGLSDIRERLHQCWAVQSSPCVLSALARAAEGHAFPVPAALLLAAGSDSFVKRSQFSS